MNDNTNTNLNILIAGVGGQGILLASRILGAYAQHMELDIKMNEVHGMAQRGGSVVTHVRFGQDIASPVIAEGTVDVLVCFELLETARWAHMVRPGGTVITNLQRVWPMPVITGAAEYPADPLVLLPDGVKVISMDAAAMALECGDIRAVNCVLLGALSREFRFSEQAFGEAVRACLPARAVELNLRACELGRQAI